MKRALLIVLALVLTVGAAALAAADEKPLVLASTTSTENSGLFAFLLPTFSAETGIPVHVIAVGTGQAIKLAQNGDADVLLVHHRASEEAFVAAGYGVKRYDVMYNDFVIVGPAADPAGIAGAADARAALARIAAAQAPFVSRGDDSGTHKRERELWQKAGIAVDRATGGWYREIGAGMGAALNTAAGMGGYVLSDRATWLSFANKADLGIRFQGDPALFNQYGVIAVDPKRHPHANFKAAQRFISWLLSTHGQAVIADFKQGGEPLFTPNATERLELPAGS